MTAPATFHITLDQFPMRQKAVITAIDWENMSDNEARRLRALGLEAGVFVEKLHKGMFGSNDPIALQVGRMMVAIRKVHARAISIEPVSATVAV